MYLNFMREQKIQTITLPDKVKGRYFIEDDNNKKLLVIEGIDEKWYLKSTKYAEILDIKTRDFVHKIELFENSMTFIAIGEERASLFAEAKSENNSIFKKYNIPEDCIITIGRTIDNTISYKNEFVSSNHAKINAVGGKLIVTDMESTNRTYLNGKRITSEDLKVGDVITIMGLKIIIGHNYIAFNNPNMQVSINNHMILTEYTPQKFEDIHEKNERYEEDEDEIDYFYRSPRFKNSIVKQTFKIDAPPQSKEGEKVPLYLVLGPTITIGLATVTMATFTIINAQKNNTDMSSIIPSLAMSFSMLAGTLLWPLLTKQYEKKRRIKQEKLRQEKYIEYINSIRKEIIDESEKQKKILLENNIDFNEIENRIKNIERNLWERVIGQEDFLEIRLGLGNLPLVAEFEYPEKSFSLQTDNLKDELYKLALEPKKLQEVPVTYSLVNDWVSGLIGKKDSVLDFVKGLIMQITALHSYDEVKIVLLYDEKDGLDFARWLPHTWSDDEKIRFIAKDSNELKEISAYLEKKVSYRIEKSSNRTENDIKEYENYYVVISTDKDLTNKAEFINMLLKQDKNIGFSLITAYDELKSLPKECTMVTELDGSNSKIYNRQDINNEILNFIPDKFNSKIIEELAINMSNIKLDLHNKSFALPTMITFLEMFKVGKIEHLNILKRWKENDPTLSLQTPVGVNEYGDTFMLDLHEKYHGPHGLIAGMTGSGKSEFIITYILSLAVNYHPDEVAFILIDYKGGGLAGAFQNDKYCLPHLVGTITNLDGASVKRSLISLQSELKRRQTIFNEARKISNEGTMDIYKYQKLYRQKIVDKPVPHLFIISDEFAELKSQQPEFMEQLISTARIGRSLGVHLILATQKPSGVVDDQIWSNSKFKVCLKVQDGSDSMEIIKKPDAASLTETGRFYLQVGYNEFFALGQSAWCGAPYLPSENVNKDEDNSIVVIDNTGRHISQMKQKSQAGKMNAKQIVEIMKYITELAKEENIVTKQLWLDPIPSHIYMDELENKYSYVVEDKRLLNPIIGEIDNPSNQEQLLFALPISTGNVIVYGAANSGKDILLKTMIYGLIKNYSSQYLNLYLIDMGAETLKLFKDAPQVGDVVLLGEVEKTKNLIKMLKDEVNRRRKLLSEFGGDYDSYYQETGKVLENIVVIINNYEVFFENYEEMEQELVYLSREGTKYGIYFVITSDSTNGVRYKLAYNFSNLVVLQLNDLLDYSNVLGSVDGVYPSKIKGRGIIKSDKTYEFQTAYISRDYTNKDIIEFCKSLTGKKARKIPILPDKVDAKFLSDELKDLKNVPIGVNKESLEVETINIKDKYLTLILSTENKNISNFEQGICELTSELTDVVVLDPLNMFEKDENKKYKYVTNNFEDEIVALFNLTVERNNRFKREKIKDFNQVVYVINSITKLLEELSDDGKDKLKVLLEKGSSEYCINILVCDIIENVSRISYDEWYKKYLSKGNGIWIGNDVTKQYELKIGSYVSELYQEIGNNFGYIIENGKTKLIKIVLPNDNN